jgi:hypothetical protein
MKRTTRSQNKKDGSLFEIKEKKDDENTEKVLFNLREAKKYTHSKEYIEKLENIIKEIKIKKPIPVKKKRIIKIGNYYDTITATETISILLDIINKLNYNVKLCKTCLILGYDEKDCNSRFNSNYICSKCNECICDTCFNDNYPDDSEETSNEYEEEFDIICLNCFNDNIVQDNKSYKQKLKEFLDIPEKSTQGSYIALIDESDETLEG